MSLRILLVDDEPAIKIGFRQLTDWSKTAYTLCGTASNGEEALLFLKTNPVDIIITDLKMPVMDGISLIHTLKQQHIDIPTMVLSNYSDFDLVREALTAGAVDYLLKTNISANLLMEHLDKIAANIKDHQKDLQESIYQKQQMEIKNTKIVLNELRDFFLDETISAEELSQETSENIIFKEPCIIITLYFHEDMKREKLKRVEHNIKTMLIETLSLAASPISIMTHHNEILYCIANSHILKNIIQKKSKLLIRQISTYFGVSPILCYSDSSVGFEECRNSYRACINAREMNFYDKKTSVFFTQDIQFIFQTAKEEISVIIDTILSYLHSGKQEDTFQYMDDFLNHWAKLPIEPLLLRMNCVHIFEAIALSCDARNLHTQIHDCQQKIIHADSFDNLKKLLYDGILLLEEGNGNEFTKYKREVQMVIRFINMHYQKHITLDEIADAANLNKSYLCRLFKKEYGDSIFNYLNSVRMEKAAEMLRKNSNIYVQEVAASVGIEEPFYFTRRFKEYFGISPRDYIIQTASVNDIESKF